MQAALLVRTKRKHHKSSSKLNNLPRHLATREIPPFPKYRPYQAWLPEEEPLQKQSCSGEVVSELHPAASLQASPSQAVRLSIADPRLLSASRCSTTDQQLRKPSSSTTDHGDVTHSKQRASDAHRRWLRKNQVEDAAKGSEKGSRVLPAPVSSAANVVLYVGLGLSSLGLVMTFVGLGDRGFQTQELRLIGPSLIGSGAIFCLLRIFFCSLEANWCLCCRKNDDQKSLLEDGGHKNHVMEDGVQSQDDAITIPPAGQSGQTLTSSSSKPSPTVPRHVVINETTKICDSAVVDNAQDVDGLPMSVEQLSNESV